MKTLYMVIAAFLTVSAGCKKFIAIDPPRTQLISATVFAQDETATAAMMNNYINMASTMTLNMALFPGLSADEWMDYSNNPNNKAFAQNRIAPVNQALLSNCWSPAFQTIYAANAALEGLAVTGGLTEAVRRQLTGEARFIRAWTNFYLVQLFGDIPLLLTTDVETNRAAPRTQAATVMAQVIADLQEAESLLAADYLNAQNAPTAERTRPNSAAATALLSRVLLYAGQWAEAAQKASELIDDTRYGLTAEPAEVFLKNSAEAIWQLMPVRSGYNTIEGNQFIASGRPPIVALQPSLVAAFDANDKRKNQWIGATVVGADTFFFPLKYKVQQSAPAEEYTEYSMALRLAEQYLIRAEARAWLNDLPGALDDLNAVRRRAGLEDSAADTRETLLDALLAERQKELFTEWGHRWLDLKRTGKADFLLGSIKTNWQTTDQLYPIPQTEIQDDPQLSQNPGY